MKRSKHTRQTPDEPQTPTPESRYHVAHYGKSRTFAAYEGPTLIAVTLYRKGVEAITARLTEKDRRIADLQSQLAAAAVIFPRRLQSCQVNCSGSAKTSAMATVPSPYRPPFLVVSLNCRDGQIGNDGHNI